MVDPVYIEQMLKVLRRNGVAAFKCEQYELVLEREIPEEITLDMAPNANDRGVEEINMAYDHLGFDPDKSFPPQDK